LGIFNQRDYPNLPLNKVYQKLKIGRKDEIKTKTWIFERRKYKFDWGDSTIETFDNDFKANGIIEYRGEPYYITSFLEERDPYMYSHGCFYLDLQHVFTGVEVKGEYYKRNNKVKTPIVTFTEYELVDFEQDCCVLMDKNGELRSDLRLPIESGKNEIIDEFNKGSPVILVVSNICGEEEVQFIKK